MTELCLCVLRVSAPVKNFLNALVTCDEEGLSANQRKICVLLLETFPVDTLINVKVPPIRCLENSLPTTQMDACNCVNVLCVVLCVVCCVCVCCVCVCVVCVACVCFMLCVWMVFKVDGFKGVWVWVVFVQY